MQKNIKNFANQINFFYKQASICWPVFNSSIAAYTLSQKKRNKNHTKKKNKKKLVKKIFKVLRKALPKH